MKKTWIILGIILVVLLGGGVFAATQFFGKPAEQAAAPTPTPVPEKVNTIPITERPYAQMIPSANGRNLTLVIGELKKPAAEGEYELEYQSGTLLQGAFGRIDVEDLPGAELDILLGSCSAGGKCSYHEDVTGGSLLLRFEDPEKYVLKNEWAFIENEESETIFSSRDAKFVLEGDSLEDVGYAVILQTPGLPENVDQALLSDPYTVSLSESARGPFMVSIRMKEAAADAQLLAWDGTEWIELETTVEEKLATAEIDELYDAYVVVSASAAGSDTSSEMTPEEEVTE
ncbi:hypothetical protein LRY65_03985 [Candidatus Woesebacteria bacterium]|nr:hypothetical protein [Candidatus Woesebacteria bacterium]MCD8507401.1 hypothetical protein [Candidatus Woesebacteria bacterium]MCD8527341.1 hypothetical protein [Candidatus Woesebacteria bacterium]MCD8546088.1 hypothetical protein [Candidatus Woesebacteria bacterium]